MGDVLRLASVPGQYAFYRWGNVAINIWLAQPNGVMVECLRDLTAQAARSLPEGISSIHWLVEGVGLPTGAARAGLRDLSEEYREWIAAVGVVIDGGGFWASALRSAVNGIAMASDTRFVPRLYSNVDGLVDWLPEAHRRGTGVQIRGAALRAKILASVAEAVPGRVPE